MCIVRARSSRNWGGCRTLSLRMHPSAHLNTEIVHAPLFQSGTLPNASQISMPNTAALGVVGCGRVRVRVHACVRVVLCVTPRASASEDSHAPPQGGGQPALHSAPIIGTSTSSTALRPFYLYASIPKGRFLREDELLDELLMLDHSLEEEDTDEEEDSELESYLPPVHPQAHFWG